MKKRLAILAAAGALMLSVSAHAMEVKIGFLGGFTGPIESMVPPIASGAKLAIRDVNAAGGVLGGMKVAMPSGDTTCADAAKDGPLTESALEEPPAPGIRAGGLF